MILLYVPQIMDTYLNGLKYNVGCEHQGCPTSGGLFSVMCRSSVNTRIKGVNIEGIIETKTQYTDDTGLFLEYDAESLQAAINIFQLFECNTGLKSNYERQLYIHNLGPLVGKNIKLKTSKNVLKKLQKLNTSKNSSGPMKMLRL